MAIEHYSSRHQILLVGEGDFSFSACLANKFGSATNMIATSLHSEAVLGLYHPTAAANLDFLEEKGCTIVHNVNACSMSNRRCLRNKRFHRIVFNFPHAGFNGRSEHDLDQISLHQSVVRGFLKNASVMLVKKGEVHVTHKTAYPYSLWENEKLGEEEGLVFKGSTSFYRRDYPGYINKKGSGPNSNRTFPVGDACTYIFAKT